MGCACSKKDRSRLPAFDSSATAGDNGSRNRRSSPQVGDNGILSEMMMKEAEQGEKVEDFIGLGREQRNSKRLLKRGASEKRAPSFSTKIRRLRQGELVAAGWPSWLSAVAGEAVEGWLPLRSNIFKRLEKIGQGTYSTVYRARNIETGKMFALKKVRFNNFEPESVRFMAREIAILRRLNHQNIMKLEGIITSGTSCSIYLAFDYMEHDLIGLLSCPDVKLTHAQIKCYMWQLLRGLEHCHAQGIIHRDIKSSNILLNNEGILKIADFGLGNFLDAENKKPLTSHLVTLWYRPPELLLGATNYDTSVDIWSVGCVFAELFLGKPLIKGRTEVEQLHRIFKLCGSPPDDFWRKCKLPLANMFKPQNQYESSLRGRCEELPRTAIDILEKFLSIEPYKRGTTSSALASEYFTTKPYACNSSSLPKNQPHKEIDAWLRDSQRKRVTAQEQGSGASRSLKRLRKPLREPITFHITTEESVADLSPRNNGCNSYFVKEKKAMVHQVSFKANNDKVRETSKNAEELLKNNPLSVTATMTTMRSVRCARKRIQETVASTRTYGDANSTSQNLNARESSCLRQANGGLNDIEPMKDEDFLGMGFSYPNGHEEVHDDLFCRQQSKRGRPDFFDICGLHEAEDVPVQMKDCQAPRADVAFSGPLMLQSHSASGRIVSHSSSIC